MIGLALDSAKLLFAGKLFKDTNKAMLLFALGAGGGLVAGVVVGQFAPLWVAALCAGGVAGMLQPMLLKNVKYA